MRYSYVPERDGQSDRARTDEGDADLSDEGDRPTPVIDDPFALATTISPDPDHVRGSWNDLLRDVGGGKLDVSILFHKYGFGVEQVHKALEFARLVRDEDQDAIRELRALWDSRFVGDRK